MQLYIKTLPYTLVLLLLLSGKSFAETTNSVNNPPAFLTGEKLTYSLGWQFIKVGMARTRVLPDEEVDGRKVRSFKMIARTYKAGDLLFKVRDTLFALTEYDLKRGISYSKDQQEGKTKRKISVKFDFDKLEANYDQPAKKNRSRTTPILENTLDPLSAFYYVRMQNMKVGTVISGPISDGKRCKIAEIKVVAEETITVNGKKYKTFKLVPDIKDISGVFEKSKDANIEIWVTTDHRHIPVRMKSKVVVGSFIAELEEMVEGSTNEVQVVAEKTQ